MDTHTCTFLKYTPTCNFLGGSFWVHINLSAEVIRLPKTRQRFTVRQAEVGARPEEGTVILLLLNQSPLTETEEVFHSQAMLPAEVNKEKLVTVGLRMD